MKQKKVVKRFTNSLILLILLLLALGLWGVLVDGERERLIGSFLILGSIVAFWAAATLQYFYMPMSEKSDLILERLGRLERLLEKAGGSKKQEAGEKEGEVIH
jgi:hypothetical protein